MQFVHPVESLRRICITRTIFDCPDIMKIWEQHFPCIFQYDTGWDVFSIINKVLDGGGLDGMEKMIYIAWSQWHGHNQRIFESQLVHPHAAVHSPSCLFLDYKRLVRELPGSSICRKVWLAPKPGELKLNINGAIFPYQKHAWTGCVLQDERPGLCSYGCNNKKKIL